MLIVLLFIYLKELHLSSKIHMKQENSELVICKVLSR